MATPEDLEETAQFRREDGPARRHGQGRRRDAGQLKAALEDGIAELGKLDIVVTAAGIAGMKGSAICRPGST